MFTPFDIIANIIRNATESLLISAGYTPQWEEMPLLYVILVGFVAFQVLHAAGILLTRAAKSLLSK